MLEAAATSLQDPELFANPDSIHRLGLKAAGEMRLAAKNIAERLHCLPEEIIFTSGGSESINTALRGFIEANSSVGNHIISTKTEHKATLEVLRFLSEHGYEVTYLPVDKWGAISLADFKAALRSNTIAISFTHVNNETGAILEDVASLAACKKLIAPRAAFHLDCVQSLGKLPISLGQWGVDLASFSGHKIHGLKGVGILYQRKGCRIEPLILGGGQQGGRRSGTQSLFLAQSMALALTLAEERRGHAYEKVARLKQLFTETIAELNPTINSPQEGSPYILNLSLADLQAETLLHALEEESVYISTVSACASRKQRISHVLAAMGIDRNIAARAIRISFSAFTTEEEIIFAAKALKNVYNRYRI